jgi:hypothetical protein
VDQGLAVKAEFAPLTAGGGEALAIGKVEIFPDMIGCLPI